MENAVYPILENQDNKKVVKIPLREYTFHNSCFPTSVKSLGQEILNGPIRLVCMANNEDEIFEPAKVFSVDYKDDALTLAGAMQSKVLFVNTNTNIEEDGCAFVDLSIMPRGLSVPQIFGLEPQVFHRRVINKLWLEVPFKKECATYYQVAPTTYVYGDFPTDKDDPWEFSWAGLVPDTGFTTTWASQIMLTNDDIGFGLFFHTKEHWNIKDSKKALEVVDNGDEFILRIHLLDGEPDSWCGRANDDDSMWLEPVTFHFGFTALPFREINTDACNEKAIQIDCFKKLPNDYDEFLSAPVVEGDTEIGFDRLKRLGVEVLYLHEKWNDMQNCPFLTDVTKKRAKYIVKECHKRGIKVVPYFGFEISTLAPYFSEFGREWKRISGPDNTPIRAWNRWPCQRPASVCMNSGWADVFVKNVKKVIEEMDFDGIYLDGAMASKAAGCANHAHGCGYIDENGKSHPTHSLYGIRKVFKEIYKFIKSRNGIMNSHCNAYMTLPALNYCTSVWEGENFQGRLLHGEIIKMPEGHIRMMFGSKHFGVPVYSLCYSNDPVWSYHNAIATQLLHNSMPKPVDIGAPLEETSRVWKAYDAFPVAKSEFKPYYTDNGVATSDKRVKVSYYDAGDKIMAVVAGTEMGIECDVTVDFSAIGAKNLTDAITKEKVADGSSYTARIDGFEYKLILADKN